MLQKIKLYGIITLLMCGLVFTGYKFISLSIQKRQLTETLGEAQERLATEIGLHQAVLSHLTAKDTENKTLRDSLTKMEKAGAKIISIGEIRSESKKATKEITLPESILQKCPELKETKIPCDLDLSVSADLAVLQTINNKIFWEGRFKVFDGENLLAELEPNYEVSTLKFTKEAIKPKRKWHGWQIGVGISYDPYDQDIRPVVYVGYGITF